MARKEVRMRIKILFFYILVCLCFQFTSAQSNDKIEYLELPAFNTSNQIIKHIGYTLSYSEEHEQAKWVAYDLTRQEVYGTIRRTNDFREDPLVTTGSATKADYKGSGYDRGHLAPAADMKWSQKAMSESFFMSNMSPQKPRFNRGIWKKLEGQVRKWAISNDEIYVVTGPILEEGLLTIGINNVSAPGAYFKVILDYKAPEIKAIGFILPNQSSKQPLKTYAVSVDFVEDRTGIDFFYKLPDDIENRLESTFDLSKWAISTAKYKRPYKAKPPAQEQVKSEYSKCDKGCPSTMRTGAICRDGTHSKSTGQGACSRHGGVKCWKCLK